MFKNIRCKFLNFNQKKSAYFFIIIILISSHCEAANNKIYKCNIDKRNYYHEDSSTSVLKVNEQYYIDLNNNTITSDELKKEWGYKYYDTETVDKNLKLINSTIFEFNFNVLSDKNVMWFRFFEDNKNNIASLFGFVDRYYPYTFIGKCTEIAEKP